MGKAGRRGRRDKAILNKRFAIAIFLAGTAALLVGSTLLLAKVAVYEVSAFLTIFGALASFTQVFFAFPLISLKKDQAEAAESAAGAPPARGQRPAGPDRTGQHASRPAALSRVHGWTLILAAPLLFLTGIIGLEGTGTSRNDLAYHSLALAVGIAVPLGIVAFNAPHTGAARRLGVAAIVFILANWVISDLANFLYIIDFSSGARVPGFIFTLFKWDALAAIGANIFLGAAISLGRFYPRWIPWLCLANAAAETFYVFRPGSPAVLDINLVGDLVLAAAYAVIGYYLLRRVPALSTGQPAPG
jgi:hypothetical protein